FRPLTTTCSRDHTTSGRQRHCHCPPAEGRMLLYEYKLRLSRAQAAAIDEAIRTTQDCSGVLPGGTPCRKRLRKTLSMRTHVCPRCGLILDRDHNAAAVILQHGLAVARADGRWPQERSETRERGR